MNHFAFIRVFDKIFFWESYGVVLVSNLAVLPLDCDRHGEINTSNAAGVSDAEACSI